MSTQPRRWVPSAEEAAQLWHWLVDADSVVEAGSWHRAAVTAFLRARVRDLLSRKDGYRPVCGDALKVFREVNSLSDVELGKSLARWVDKWLEEPKEFEIEMHEIKSKRDWFAGSPELKFPLLGRMPLERIEQLEKVLDLVPEEVQVKITGDVEWWSSLEQFIGNGDTKVMEKILKEHPESWVAMRILLNANYGCNGNEVHEGKNTSDVEAEISGDEDVEMAEVEGMEVEKSDKEQDDEKHTGSQQTKVFWALDFHADVRVNMVPGHGVIPKSALALHDSGKWRMMPDHMQALSQFLTEFDVAKEEFQSQQDVDIHAHLFLMMEGNFSFIKKRWPTLSAPLEKKVPALSPVEHWQKLSLGFEPEKKWWNCKLLALNSALHLIDAFQARLPHTTLLWPDRQRLYLNLLQGKQVMQKSHIDAYFMENSVVRVHADVCAAIFPQSKVTLRMLEALKGKVVLSRTFPEKREEIETSLIIVASQVSSLQDDPIFSFPWIAPILAVLMDEGGQITRSLVRDRVASCCETLKLRAQNLNDGEDLREALKEMENIEEWSFDVKNDEIKFIMEGLIPSNTIRRFLSSNTKEFRNVNLSKLKQPEEENVSKLRDLTSWNALQPDESCFMHLEAASVAVTKDFRVVSVQTASNATLFKFPASTKAKTCLKIAEMRFINNCSNKF